MDYEKKYIKYKKKYLNLKNEISGGAKLRNMFSKKPKECLVFKEFNKNMSYIYEVLPLTTIYLLTLKQNFKTFISSFKYKQYFKKTHFEKGLTEYITKIKKYIKYPETRHLCDVHDYEGNMYNILIQYYILPDLFKQNINMYDIIKIKEKTNGLNPEEHNAIINFENKLNQIVTALEYIKPYIYCICDENENILSYKIEQNLANEFNKNIKNINVQFIDQVNNKIIS
jgi:hypothetical protein